MTDTLLSYDDALAAYDPVPTREILAVHRRSMTQSPAVAAVLAGLTSG